MSPTDRPNDTVHCESCGAVNPSYRARCSGCKAPLPDPGDEASSPPVREAQQRRVRIERRARTGGALKKAQNAIRGVRGIYWLYAGLLALAGLAQVLTGGDGPDPQGVQMRGFITLAAAAGVSGGALLLARYPIACTNAITVLAFGVAVAYLDTANLNIKHKVRFAVAMGLMSTIPVITKALRLMDAEGIDRDKLWNHESRSEGRSMGKAALIAAGGALLAILAATTYFAIVTRPGPTFEEILAKEPPIEAAISDWTEAMEAADYDRARGMGTDHFGTKWPKVVAILEREGWADEGLTLVAFTLKNERAGRKEVHFDLPRGLMKTLWLLEDDRWRPQSISFKGVRAR